jgi:hypothetical protein
MLCASNIHIPTYTVDQKVHTSLIRRYFMCQVYIIWIFIVGS